MADRLDFPDFTLVYMSNAEASFELELTINKGRTEPYDRGDGYGHLAFVVDDLERLHQDLHAKGLAPKDIKQLRHEDRVVGTFFFIADPDGYQIEVFRREGRFK